MISFEKSRWKKGILRNRHSDPEGRWIEIWEEKVVRLLRSSVSLLLFVMERKGRRLFRGHEEFVMEITTEILEVHNGV